jgi:uncharacterized membrane-anchored protein
MNSPAKNKIYPPKKRHDLSFQSGIMAVILSCLTSWSVIMFWGVILLVGLGVVFTKLGAYSVIVVMLSSALKLVVVVALGAFVWLFFKKKAT